MCHKVATLTRLFLNLPYKFCSMALLEAMSMKTGELVNAQTFSDGSVLRRVVETKGDTVYICTEEEWLSAQKEHREPTCVGFNKRYVGPVTAEKSYHKSV
jgi:hypothetical protein